MPYLLVFHSKEFGDLRVIRDMGVYLFCGNDVAAALGYRNKQKAVTDHCHPDHWAYYWVEDSVGHWQKTRFLSRSNLFRLIVKCPLPAAKPYRVWICQQVLPVIRDGQPIAEDGVCPLAYLGQKCAELFGKTADPAPQGKRKKE